MPDAPTTPAPKVSQDQLMKAAPFLIAGALLAGGLIGLRLARKFVVPAVPPFPKATQPCSECAQRRAAEIQAEREQARIARMATPPASAFAAPVYAPEDLDDDPPGFDQTKIETPKTFSPHQVPDA